MFSDTTLNRIYDRGNSVYNYSLDRDDFTIGFDRLVLVALGGAAVIVFLSSLSGNKK